MAAQITPISASRGAAYLIKSVGVEMAGIDHEGVSAYFSAATRAGEPAGRWMGRQAEADGILGAEVTAEQLDRVFKYGRDPVTGAQRGQAPRTYRPINDRLADVRARGQREGWSAEQLHEAEIAERAKKVPEARTGFDVTFTPPKSVSILFGLAPDEATRQKLMDIHENAVAQAFWWLEDRAVTRTGANGIRQVDVEGLEIALFTHRTSRSGDPHLHTHGAVSAKVKTADGRWLALDGQVLYQLGQQLKNVYELEVMSAGAEEFGLTYTRRRSGVMEVEGISDELIRHFSKSAVAIEADMEAHGYSLEHRFGSEASKAAWYRTRLPKGNAETTVALGARWRAAAERIQPGAFLAAMARRMEIAGLPEHTWRELVAAAERTTMPAQALLDHDAARILVKVEGITLPPGLSVQDEQRISAALSAAVPSWRLAHAVALMESERTTWTESHMASTVKRVLEAHPELVRRVPVEHGSRGGRGRRAGRGEQLVRLDLDAEVARTTREAMARCVRLSPSDPTDGFGPRRKDGHSAYERPHGVRYTTTAILDAEAFVRDMARLEGAVTFTGPQVAVGIRAVEAHRPGVWLTEGQVGVLEKVLADEHRIKLLVGAAGAGKTAAMAAIVESYRARGLGVIGLAPSQVAAVTLGEEAGMPTANTAMFLHPRSIPGNQIRQQVKPGTLIIVDEASMATTSQLAGVVRFALDHGADVLLVGDHGQLGAVGAGGMFKELTRSERTAELLDVQRFRDPDGTVREWEAVASLKLRQGGTAAIEALAAYDRHRRIVSAPECELLPMAVSDTAADLTRGKTALLIVATEAQAAELSGAVRARLVAAGKVDDQVTRQLADGNVVGAGDLVVTRLNRHRQQIANRDQWWVTKVTDNGGMAAVRVRDGFRTVFTPETVREEVQLGYAGTSHSVQGLTVDIGRNVWDQAKSWAANYVDMTRGRERNLLLFPNDALGYEAERPREVIRMVAASSERSTLDELSADEVARHETDAHRSLAQLAATLHDLVASEDPPVRVIDVVAEVAPLAAEMLRHDPNTQWLSRDVAALCRDDWDGAEALRSVARAPIGFEDVRSVADVLRYRLNRAFSNRASLAEEVGAPIVTLASSPARWVDHVFGGERESPGAEAVRMHMVERAQELCDRVDRERPAWTAEVPGLTSNQRAMAVHAVALYRDLAGWDGSEPLGPEPSRGERAERAAWRVAQDTLEAAKVELPKYDDVLLREAQRTQSFVLRPQDRNEATVALLEGRAFPDPEVSDQARNRALRHAVLRAAAEQCTPSQRAAIEEAVRARRERLQATTDRDPHQRGPELDRGLERDR